MLVGFEAYVRNPKNWALAESLQKQGNRVVEPQEIESVRLKSDYRRYVEDIDKVLDWAVRIAIKHRA